MTTQFDLGSTARFRVREVRESRDSVRGPHRPKSTPRLYRAESTAPLAMPEPTAILTRRSIECRDVTTAAAWSASPLGDPTDEDGSLSDSADSDADQPVEDEKPRASGRWTLIVAALVGALGGAVVLAVVVAGHTVWGHPRGAVVSPDASVGSVGPQVPAAASSTQASTSQVMPAATPSVTTAAPSVTTAAPTPVPAASSAPVPQNRGTGPPRGNQDNKGLNLPCLNLPGLSQPGGNRGGLNQTGTPGCQPQLPGKQPPSPQLR
jgi:hypothetical protein